MRWSRPGSPAPVVEEVGPFDPADRRWWDDRSDDSSDVAASFGKAFARQMMRQTRWSAAVKAAGRSPVEHGREMARKGKGK